MPRSGRCCTSAVHRESHRCEGAAIFELRSINATGASQPTTETGRLRQRRPTSSGQVRVEASDVGGTPAALAGEMHRRVALCVFVMGCTGELPEPAPDAGSPEVVYLSPTEHLVRAAMTLRGKRPSAEELAQVAADPDAISAIVEGYVQSPELGSIMRDLHAETLLVRVDLAGTTFQSKNGVADRTAGEMNTVYEEPLRLIEHVVMNDRPYSEIVTADYAISDPITAVVWGMTHSGGTGLEVSHWLDSRPVAGILSSSGLWARHISAGANYHRNRANLISSTLLCFDFLHSDIVLDTSIDLADPVIVANAVVANPSCAGCHQALDPIASTLRGFQFGARYANYPVEMWRQQWFDEWEAAGTHRPPSFFGQTASSPVDVGQRIASDPRFPRCTADRFVSYFMQMDRERVPFVWGAALADKFVANGMNAKQLAKDIVLSDEFRVSHVTDGASDEEAEGLHGMLRARPEQLDTLFEDLTGFRWRTVSTIAINGAPYGVADLLRGDFLGFRALAGGIDSYFVTRPTHTTNAVSSLLLRELARSAAGFVVDHDFAAGAQRTLLEVAEAERSPSAIRAEIARLHARIYGAIDAPDSEAVSETYELFAAVLADTNDTRHAWRTTLTAMLSDLRVAYY